MNKIPNRLSIEKLIRRKEEQQTLAIKSENQT